MEVYPKGVQPIRENHPRLIPISEKLTKKRTTKKYEYVGKRLKWNEALLSAANSFSRNVNDTELVMTSRIWRMNLRVSSSFG